MAMNCRWALGCCLVAGVLASGRLDAAEPAGPSKTKQREAVEAILAKPVEWTPADPQSITIDAFIAHVREKHGLAIRWDTTSVGLTVAGSDMLSGLSASAHRAVTVWNPGAPSPYVQTYSPVVPARLQKHITNFAPPAEALPPAIDPNAKPAAPPEKLSPNVIEDVQPAPLTADTPKPRPTTAPAAPEEEDEELPHQLLSARPISPSAIALTSASVGEVLQQLLDAAAPPITDTGESLGMPLSIRALTLDYIIEGRAVVITTRLRANAVKETRVYQISNLKGVPPEQVAKVICHSIRPWSWRSQASEIADRLAARLPKTSMKLPQISVASQYIPSPILTTSAADGSTPPEAEPTGPPSPLPQQQAELSAEDLANLGQLLTGGALAAVETVVNTFEIVHYGDPPTAVMEVLPGVLVITQSQGAHREIAELLEQLAAARTP
jgi:hypothetical protein